MVNDVTAVFPKVSALTPTKPVPVIVTVSPPVAPVGEKAVITGTPAKLKPERAPVPFGVVTEISPDAPAAAGAAVMRVAETTVNDAAGTPPKLTALAPVKFVPLMVTTSPAPATAGLNDVIAGDGINTKPASEDVPYGVRTLTLPDAANAGTVAVICEAELTTNEATTPPMRTVSAPEKLLPAITTLAPTPALVGEKLATTGGARKVKPAIDAAPASVVTLMLPEAAPEGTEAVI